MTRKRPQWVKSSARREISELLKLAEKDPKRAKRYITLAKKMSKTYKSQLSSTHKKRICKKCGILLVPGKSLRVRTGKKHTTIYTCLKCGKTAKYPYSEERFKKRKIKKNNTCLKRGAF